MAIFTMYQSTNMSEISAWFGTVTIANNSQIQINDGSQTQNYFGYFSYPFGVGVAGTITESEYYVGGQKQWDITSESVDAGVVASYIQSGDAQGALDYVLSGSDYISGTSGSDVLLGYGGDDRLLCEGNDTVTGGAGHDSFWFMAPGNYVVTDFTGEDELVFHGVPDLQTLASMITNIQAGPAQSVVEFGSFGSITLVGFDLATLNPDQLVFFG